MTDNIITMPTPFDKLADKIRKAYERTEHGRQEWIEGMLELAVALTEARERFESNRAFSIWLAENELDRLSYQDRAALIAMGREPNVFRQTLIEQNEQHLPNTIWQKHRNRFQIHLKTESKIEIAAKAVSIPGENENTLAEKQEWRTRKRVFEAWPRGDEVHALYATASRTTIAKALSAMSKKAALDMWNMILQAMDGGLLIANNCHFMRSGKLHLRLLCPDAPLNFANRFDLTKASDREEIKRRLLPAMLANVEAIRAKPESLPQLIKDHWHGEQVQEAVKVMPDNQEQVVMFGVQLWPRVGQQYGDYDYDQLRVGCWFFRDFRGWVTTRVGNSPVSVAIVARQSTWWFKKYLRHAQLPDDADMVKRKMTGVFQVVDLLADLHERNPDGEQRFPSSPNIEGEW